MKLRTRQQCNFPYKRWPAEIDCDFANTACYMSTIDCNRGRRDVISCSTLNSDNLLRPVELVIIDPSLYVIDIVKNVKEDIQLSPYKYSTYNEWLPFSIIYNNIVKEHKINKKFIQLSLKQNLTNSE